MICWKCRIASPDSLGKIGFRETCPKCHTDLHVCKNCRFYSVGKPNDCLILGTDRICEKDLSNLCEDFQPLVFTLQENQNTKTIEIFGEDPSIHPKKFDDLFK